MRGLGLEPSLWRGIATSGDAGISRLKTAPRPVGFIGTRSDRAILEDRGVRIADHDDFAELACAGLDEVRRSVSDYEQQLRAMAARGALMHCLNPDRVVIRGGVPEPCAGALADIYAGLGGRVEYYGKPYPAVYRHAMMLAGEEAAGKVLAIGDGLTTDVLGAARMGFDCVYVTGGISQGEAIPADFAATYDLGNWQPVAVVNGLD